MVLYDTGTLIPFVVKADHGKRYDVIECILNLQCHKCLSDPAFSVERRGF